MILFAMPAVMLCSTMLSADRLSKVNTQFFNPAEGSDPLLWQHLFWFFAHPEVYIIFLPATGFISEILPTFSRRRMFGYTALVLANVSVAFIGFGVWVHHMFATPLPELGQGLFTASSLMITIPNGVQFFCWIATLWGGRPFVRVPMGFVLAFFADLPDRRADGRDARLGVDQFAGARHLLRRRPPALRPDRRGDLPAVRRVLLLVPEVDRADDVRARWAGGTSPSCSSGSTSRSSRCTCWGCEGCPGGSTRIRPGWGGIG